MRTLAAILLLSLAASAQIIRVEGGDFSMYDGYGASTTLFFSHHNATAAAACLDTGCSYSISDAFMFHKAKVTVGDSDFNFSGTGAGLFLQNRGIALAKGGLTAFIGQTGTGFRSLPFAKTYNVEHFGVGAAYTKTRAGWTFQGLGAVSGGQKSLLESASYESGKWRLAESAGLLSNKFMFNGQAGYRPKEWLSVFASHQNYVYQGFRWPG